MKSFSAKKTFQQGSILLVAVIFLLFFTLLAMSVFKGSMSSMQSIGNMQWRNESITAANDAIDRLLSTPSTLSQFATTTAAVNASPFRYDPYGDTNLGNDILVNFPVVTIDGVARAGPRCLRSEPLPAKNLNYLIEADRNCMSSDILGQTGFGIAVTGGSEMIQQGVSLCSNTEWSVTVRASDAVTNTSVDVVQGIGMRVLTTLVATCD